MTGQVRGLFDRSAVGLLIGLSVLLMVLGKADMKLASYISERVGDAAVPVLRVLGEPVAAVRGVIDRVGALLAVYEENERLREENRRLLAWQAEASKLAVQNRALRQMLNLPPPARDVSWTTARVVADSAGMFVRSVLVDAGSQRGVADGMAAVTPQGLAGRVIDAGCCSARVLLITDLNSSVPVVVERSGDQALLVGDNGPEPGLRFLPLNPDFRVGDRILTSGRGGLIPPGLTIGRISAVTDAKIAVQPFVDWARLDHVSLLRYEGVTAPGGESGGRSR
jgi:rod shape-determining protein MreC